MCGRAYEPRFLFSWPVSRCSVMGPDQLTGVMTQVAIQAAQAYDPWTPDSDIAVPGRNSMKKDYIRGRRDLDKEFIYNLRRIIPVHMFLMMASLIRGTLGMSWGCVWKL
jgi:acetyl-CoA carboxylase carboxyltransferase component